MNRDDKKRIGVRSLSLIALLLMAALLAACGGQSKPEPPPGSPEQPAGRPGAAGRRHHGTPQRGRALPRRGGGLGAEGAKAKADAQPGYQKLVERQAQQAAQPVHARATS